MRSTFLLNDIANEFTEVRDKTMELFSPLDIEDAVIQSSSFGSPPNWHIAHVTWFFQKILEKYGRGIVFDNKFNLNYLNSYYNKYGKILLKNERGKYPRPTVMQSIKYRSEIEKQFIDFLRSLDNEGFSVKLILDIYTAINHEMQHQELMVYDFQHYFNRFPEESDNYCPKKRNKKMPIK